MQRYFIWRADAEQGPFTAAELWALRQVGSLPDVLPVREEDSDQWLQVSDIKHRLHSPVSVDHIRIPPRPIDYSAMPPAPLPTPATPAAPAVVAVRDRRSDKSRGVYIILGLVFGFFGFHNFYAGHYGRGVAQLVITFTLGWIIIGLILNFFWVVAELISETEDGEGNRMS